jgi:hypothetical protein
MQLAWGVKQSFRGYVAMAGGAAAVSGGAEAAGEAGFVFPAAPDGGDLAAGPDGRAQGTGRFVGAVRFTAHGGMLSVALADPWVEAGRGVLSLADAGGRRVDFATLGAGRLEPDGTLALPTAITLEGMMILGDHYPPGTALDEVRVAGLG